MEIKEMLKFIVTDKYGRLQLSPIFTSVAVCFYCEETIKLTITYPGLFGQQDSECNQVLASEMHLHVIWKPEGTWKVGSSSALSVPVLEIVTGTSWL